MLAVIWRRSAFGVFVVAQSFFRWLCCSLYPEAFNVPNFEAKEPGVLATIAPFAIHTCKRLLILGA